jgi:spore maturation protein CgeB
LRERFGAQVRDADLVIVGSYVPDGMAVGDWVQSTARGLTAFYDIDTPVTLARLARGEHDYLAPRQIGGYDLYLSFTAGPTLHRLEQEFGSPCARAFYCSVDPALYFPEPQDKRWDLGYMGTYSDDRQPGVERLLLEPARQHPEGRFIVAGPQYPEGIAWPANVDWQPHLPPAQHRAFYNRQRWTLNITRADMVAAGWSPSVRLFEAAACGTPIVSDRWQGIEDVLVPGREIVLADSTQDALAVLRGWGEDERLRLAERARARILAEHTAAHRAAQL